MSESNTYYRLVFTGELLPGFSKPKVVSQLQEVLHLDEEKAERLVEGKHRQIDKKLTLDRAEKLRVFVLEQGADCVLQPIDEAFIDTEQLPVFARGDRESKSQSDAAEAIPESSNKSIESPPAGDSETQSTVSGASNDLSPQSSNTKLKYILGFVFVLLAAIVMWSIKPAPEQSESASSKQGDSNVKTARQNSDAIVMPISTKYSTVTETETYAKLQNLSVRTGLWFAGRGGGVKPTEVKWSRIQDDLGVDMQEMNDSWGKVIKYIGRNEGFELRSAGPDRIYFTKDDISRETYLQ